MAGVKGRHWTLSAETRARQSAAARRRPPRSEAHCKALSEARKGKKRSPEAIEKTRQTMLAKGKNHHNYKEQVGYSGLHYCVYTHLGKASKCEHCGVLGKSRYHWANVSKQYKRDLEDWIQLCPPCHALFDKGDHTRAWVKMPYDN